MAILTAPAYNPGPIQPVCLVGENIGVWTQADYWFFKVLHIEALPASRTMQQDIGAVTSATSSNITEITVARAQDGNLLHVRAAPLDPVELTVYQQRATGRHTAFSATGVISVSTGNRDPHYASSTYFILGKEKSIWVQVANNTGYNLAQSRVRFWGFRYVIDPLPTSDINLLRKIMAGNATLEEKRAAPGATIVSAEGREA